MKTRLRFWQVLRWEIVRWLIVGSGWIPGVLGIGLRFVLLRWIIGQTDGFFRVLEHVIIEYPENLQLGRQVGLNLGCWINARGGVEIGANSFLGPYCVVHSANHQTEDLATPIREQGYVVAPVHIGRNVWLGARVTVLPGVTIGDNAIVGAGAVVSRDVPANAVAMGVPATVKGMRE